MLTWAAGALVVTTQIDMNAIKNPLTVFSPETPGEAPVLSIDWQSRGGLVASMADMQNLTLRVPSDHFYRKLYVHSSLFSSAPGLVGYPWIAQNVQIDLVFQRNGKTVGTLPYQVTTTNGWSTPVMMLSQSRARIGMMTYSYQSAGGSLQVIAGASLSGDYMSVTFPAGTAWGVDLDSYTVVIPAVYLNGYFESLTLVPSIVGQAADQPAYVYGYIQMSCLSSKHQYSFNSNFYGN
jgi:hypothetical protein